MSYRVLMIGLGNIGYGYDAHDPALGYTHASALTLNQHFSIVAAIDPLAACREKFSAQYQIPCFSTLEDWVEAATDSEDELRPPHAFIDIVVIATPSPLHLEHCSAVMNLKPKVIVVEKPLANDVIQLQAFEKLQATTNVKIMVNTFRLYDAWLNKQLQYLKGGAKFTVWCNKGLHHNAIHFLVIIYRYFGGPPNNIKFDRNQNVVCLEFDSGLTHVYFNNTTIDENGFSLLTQTGMLSYLHGGRMVYLHDNNGSQLIGENENRLKGYMDDFYSAVIRTLNGEVDNSFTLCWLVQRDLFNAGVEIHD